MKLIARPGDPPQYLEEHLLEVSENIIRIIQAIPYRLRKKINSQIEWSRFIETMRLLGLVHDIAKGEISIQKALQNNKKPSISHAALSLPFFILAIRKKFRIEFYKDNIFAFAAFSLLSHHSVPHQSLEEHLVSQISVKVKGKQVNFDPQTFELVNKLLNKWNIQISKEEVFRELKYWVEAHTREIYEGKLSNFIKGDIDSRRIFVAIYNALVKADWTSAAKEKIEIKEIEDKLYQRGISIVEPSRSEVHSYIAYAQKCRDNILVEMPTGFGKTYIGTAYAFKTKRKKIIYTLPITTIIEDVYERLRKYLGDGNVKWYTSKYLTVKAAEKMDYDHMSYQDARYFNVPCVVTTLDQVLAALLNIDRYPLKEFPLYNSCLILDEPQLYSPFMLLLFSKLFLQYADLCNLIVMSATIPNFLKKNFNKIMLEPFKNKVQEFFGRYSRTYLNLDYFDASLLANSTLSKESKNVIKKHIKANERIAIVVNSVRRAQKIFEQIEYANKFLFHARYIFRDKRNKLAELKKFLEKG